MLLTSDLIVTVMCCKDSADQALITCTKPEEKSN